MTISFIGDIGTPCVAGRANLRRKNRWTYPSRRSYWHLLPAFLCSGSDSVPTRKDRPWSRP